MSLHSTPMVKGLDVFDFSRCWKLHWNSILPVEQLCHQVFFFISVDFFVAQDHYYVIPLWIQLKGSFLSRFYFVLFLFWTWFSSLILFRILSSRTFWSFENMLLVVMVNFKAVSSSTSSTDCLVRYHHLQI